MTNHAIVFLNGAFQKSKIIKYYLTKKSFIVCADGAGNSMRKLGLIPDLLIGDLDSIKSPNLKYFKSKGTTIIKVEEQETTDFEKSLMYLTSNNFKSVIVFGAMSDRTDHSLNNFSVMKRYFKQLDIRIIDNTFEIFFVNKSKSLKCFPGETVSFLGFPTAKNITTTGLEFPLKRETLEFGVREGTLNKAISKRVKIDFTEGDLLIFKEHRVR